MAKKTDGGKIKSGFSLLSNGLNVIDDKKQSGDRLNAHRRKIVEIKEDQAYEEDKLRRDAAKKEGNARARAGASGVKVSSFDDAFLSDGLETEREAAMARHRARREINGAYDDIRAERRKTRAASRNLILDGISGIIGMF